MMTNTPNDETGDETQTAYHSLEVEQGSPASPNYQVVSSNYRWRTSLAVGAGTALSQFVASNTVPLITNEPYCQIFIPLGVTGLSMAALQQWRLKDSNDIRTITFRNNSGTAWWGSLGHYGPITGGLSALLQGTIKNSWLLSLAITPLGCAIAAQYNTSVQNDIHRNPKQNAPLSEQFQHLRQQMASAFTGRHGLSIVIGLAASLTMLALLYSQDEPPSPADQWYYNLMASVIANSFDLIAQCAYFKEPLSRDISQYTHQALTIAANSLFSSGIREVFEQFGLSSYSASLVSSAFMLLDYINERGVLESVKPLDSDEAPLPQNTEQAQSQKISNNPDQPSWGEYIGSWFKRTFCCQSRPTKLDKDHGFSLLQEGYPDAESSHEDFNLN